MQKFRHQVLRSKHSCLTQAYGTWTQCSCPAHPPRLYLVTSSLRDPAQALHPALTVTISCPSQSPYPATCPGAQIPPLAAIMVTVRRL